ncbi:MAG: DUF3054 domain-containing protein [Caldilineae bacterium]|nr:MAG: DUF3054 domain-containing protein [Caldilineae bacterium]
MQSFPQDRTASSNTPSTTITLLVGDVVMLLLFVVVGRLSHGLTQDWIPNIARIATPFLIGWLVAAFAVGAYRENLVDRPMAFLARSALAWLVGDALGFLLRAFVFQDIVIRPFALATLAFTGLFLLGWRCIFLIWARRTQR